ncbi:MAG TPA: ATP-binding protein [Gemmatimonadales bacterium]|nr:ATP-binding protein [Gemmatimonadales bacterium]
MDIRELEQLLREGRESLGVEFKRSMTWADDATKAKVVKAALAIANKRDGGLLVFGMTSPVNAGPHTLDGMTRPDYESFNQDDVMSKVNAHASPSIDLTVHHVVVDGKECVAIEIREFADYPVICSNDLVVGGTVVVVKGRMYCRSRRTIETTEVRTVEDLRDILEIAVDKGLNRYFRQRAIEDRVGKVVDDAERFRQQLEGL